MKVVIVLTILLIAVVGCGRTHNAATLPISGNTGNPVSETVYSMIFGGNPDSYQSFIFRDDNTFEMFGSVVDGGGSIVEWIKVEGTYTIVGTTLTVTTNVTEEYNYTGLNCGDPLNFSYNYVESGDDIILANGAFTMTDEAASGLSKPDISALSNQCP